MKKFVSLCLLFMIANNIFASSKSEFSVTQLNLPTIDNNTLYNNYNSVPELKDNAGIDLKLEVDLIASSTPHEMVDGKWIRKLHLNAKNALGLIFNFEKLNLSENGRLNISSDLNSKVSFTKANKNSNSNNIVWGNQFDIEYISDVSYLENAQIVLKSVTYLYHLSSQAKSYFAPPAGVGGSCPPGGFININNYCYYNAQTLPEQTTDQALSCYTDANCIATPSQYCREIRSTVMIGVRYTWARIYESAECIDDTALLTNFQSGVLVNNTRNDMTPYILTAGHSVHTNAILDYRNAIDPNHPNCGKVTVRTQNTFPQEWLIYFNYQRPTCDNSISGNNLLTIKGVEILYNGLTNSVVCSDIALLKVIDNVNSNYDIPIGYDYYFSGWDINNVTSGIFTSVSHPSGDLKKIYTLPVCSTCSNPSLYTLTAGAGNPVQKGMSGSGVFDTNHKLKGITSSGSNLNSCSSSSTIHAINISTCWSALKTYLDPDNSNTNSIDGYDPLASCKTNVDVYGTMYPAATWRAQNQMTIQAQSDIISPPSNLYCSIESSPTYYIGTKQPYQTQANYIFKAGHNIQLRPGFSVKNGNKFSAQIGNCSTYNVCSSTGGYGKNGGSHFNSENRTEEVINDADILAYPNPASNSFKLNLKTTNSILNGEYIIQLIDVTGKLVLETTYTIDSTSPHQKEIDITNIKSGIYTCIVSGAQKSKFKLAVIK